MGHARRNDKEISGTRGTAAGSNRLHAFTGKIEDELGELMRMWRHLRVAVTIQLQFSQDETQRVDFDFLHQNGTPGEHDVGSVLAKVGFVLTQAAACPYSKGSKINPTFLAKNDHA
jgi:hypothetical protein